MIDRFRELPLPVRLVLWVVVWPLLAGLLLWRSRGGALRRAGAVLLLAFTPFWLAAPFAPTDQTDNSRTSRAGALQDEREAAPRSATPSTPSTTSSAPSPARPARPASPAPPTMAAQGVPEAAQRGVVERVVDGDTIWVRVDGADGPLAAGASHAIRLLEIDTPETKHPGRGVECWGPEASAFTERTLRGRTVWLESDREDVDRYGRFLRYVWLEDGTMFNEKAVREGHAKAVLYEPNDRHIRRLQAAEAEARAARRGLWGACEEASATASPRAGASGGSAGSAGTSCDPSYEGACVPPYPPDVNCRDLDERRFRSTGDDPHGLDGDGDGEACES
jgi:micrococcal nuclease